MRLLLSSQSAAFDLAFRRRPPHCDYINSEARCPSPNCASIRLVSANKKEIGEMKRGNLCDLVCFLFRLAPEQFSV